MKLHRRRWLRLLAGAATLPLAVPSLALAQAYPRRPVRILVGFAAGGGADILARLVGQWLSERLGQQFIVENRVGAASNIAAETAVNAAPDGHTLLVVSSTNAINETLYERLPFNIVRDIAPIAGVMLQPNVMSVHPSFPARTVGEFIAYAKVNPGKVNFGSGGMGSMPHMAGELFKMLAGVDMVHVPYRGAAPALTDLLGGQLQVMFDGLPSSIEHIKAGRLRPLGMTTAARIGTLPEVASLGEVLAGYEASYRGGIGAPKNTSVEIIEKLNKEVNAALANPKFNARLTEMGATALAGSPADFGKLMASEIEKWRRVVRAGNIRA
jgi:tripartite-type tricarboxylate transporter receptor subunit TctC